MVSVRRLPTRVRIPRKSELREFLFAADKGSPKTQHSPTEIIRGAEHLPHGDALQPSLSLAVKLNTHCETAASPTGTTQQSRMITARQPGLIRPKSVFSALYNIFVVSKSPFCSTDRSGDLYVQVFNPPSLSPLRSAIQPFKISSLWRTRNASCRVGRSKTSIHQLSRPLGACQNEQVVVTKFYTSRSGRSNYNTVRVQRPIGSYLKKLAVSDESYQINMRSKDAANNPLQLVAESFLKDVRTAVHQPTSPSFKALVSTIRQNFLAKIPTLPLLRWLDLAYISQNYIIGPSMRLTENILSNINGTVRQQQIAIPVTAQEGAVFNGKLAQRCGNAILRNSVITNVLPVTRSGITISRQGTQPGRSTVNISRPFTHNSNRGDVYVALGSNVGDRFDAIESACKIIDESKDVQILQTSPLYETEPMYVEDQERFLNGVCKIQTTLTPMELLDKLQSIENGLGRVKLIDKGPRNIDLDIVTYKNETVDTERLIIPHKLMREREFVLRPLCDIDGKHFSHPESGMTAATHLNMLPPSPSPMFPLTPLGPGLEIRSLDPKRRTHIMSILNITPDSFSDGGVHQVTDSSTLKATILSHIADGATIIDIGGQSSRPNAADITAEEELARVLPAISLIKSLPEASHIAISVDTYRASVASAAIEAGAHIVNDISAGLLDPDMLPTIARLGCTYIMMHMRGSPDTMQSSQNTTYPDPPGLLSIIKSELLSRLTAAEEAGIRRWRIILDPGVGFAKTTSQNLEILRRFGELRNCEELKSYPWLLGSSRKGFIGEITMVREARERGWGTGVTVAAAVQGGAEIVRVHDVEEMRHVVRMADAMYRPLADRAG